MLSLFVPIIKSSPGISHQTCPHRHSYFCIKYTSYSDFKASKGSKSLIVKWIVI